MPEFDALGRELTSGDVLPHIVARDASYVRRAPTPGRKPQLIQLASLTASALVSAEPTGASSASAGPAVLVGQYSECLLWGVISSGTGSPVGVQFGVQVADLYNTAFLLHPVGLSASTTKTSGILGVLSITTLGVALRAICVASTAYSGGTVTIWGAFKT